MPTSTLPQFVETQAPAHRIPKLIHLQVLRAIAASLVVADHGFSDLVNRGIPATGYLKSGYLLGHLGVTAFFVLSGLIMMRQSADLFGTPRGPFVFAYRRLIRIVPMYWIATLCYFSSSIRRDLLHPVKELLISLVFLPNFIHPVDRLEPVLGQGWTLNYEMFFYLLFALSLFLPRRKGILFLLIVPELLAAIGHSYAFPIAGMSSSLLNFYTDQLIVLFARGVLIGAWETESRSTFRLKLPFSPAYLLLIPAVLLLAMPYRLGRFQSWEFLSLTSILVVLCCTLVDNGIPGPILRAMVLLGDASYSTYLFHLFAYPVAIPLAIKITQHLHKGPLVMLLMVALAIVVANLIGLLIHLAIERPITRAFKRLPFDKRLPSR
jgi:exopolysaccharide production protein ExoZ